HRWHAAPAAGPGHHPGAVRARLVVLHARGTARGRESLKTGKDPRQALAQRHARLPAELVLGSRHVEAAAADLAWPRWLELGLERRPRRHLAQSVQQLEHRGLLP